MFKNCSYQGSETIITNNTDNLLCIELSMENK